MNHSESVEKQFQRRIDKGYSEEQILKFAARWSVRMRETGMKHALNSTEMYAYVKSLREKAKVARMVKSASFAQIT